MTFTKNQANTTGDKTARSCDSCIRKRARWFCAADDAFLCQACDSSIHSANPLAQKHHRICLKLASFYNETNNYVPLWHKGFSKKPRTPRHGKLSKTKDLNSHESGEHVLRRVPICTTPSPEASRVSLGCEENHGMESLHGLSLSSEIGNFDVESLLGKSECVGMEDLGLVDKGEYSSWKCCMGSGKVKMEEQMEMMMMMGREQTLELIFDYGDEEVVGFDVSKDEKSDEEIFKEDDETKRKKILLLQLDYEAVITAWASQKSPWTTGDKPDLSIDRCWPHSFGTGGMEFHRPNGELGALFGCHPSLIAEGGREARVLRYREKRRTRLFSKKIRYEVRKLNAEKRPRMKGRFVKRTSFAASPTTIPLLNK
ncbi:hypothetical protein RJT34_07259 [Clitoria ternatea]|uniref:Uncharacterized protein n=1 Tax=Clitoria ternatea TaxID=43366 RepID=A0AAN9K4J4_CLITE